MSAILSVSVSALAKSYGSLQALRDVSFDVKRGELVALIGPNGAGKTTLLSIVAGVQRPSAGNIGPAPHGVGWAPQYPALYSKLTVAENLELFARLEELSDPRAAVERMLDQTALRGRARTLVGRLSGGTRQRVNVAVALLGEPEMLLLDEPSASLDPEQRERLWAFLAGQQAHGTTVVFSTHNVGEAQRHAGRVLVLADGRLVFDGAPLELLEAAGERAGGDLEQALVRFLRERATASGAAGAHPEATL